MWRKQTWGKRMGGWLHGGEGNNKYFTEPLISLILQETEPTE
jgi:hypothetical protein